ncbi:CAMK protein kinase [Phytophthora megakarya]|uniref:CAMK protein kinase n=1 Tax=Phytophthora megakarya TaxID=4795 RepID=A0A225VXL3_9STRA|nr:CAMK protein kinase [Phytophthora megakarya]
MGVCASRRWPSLTDFYELDSPEVILGVGTSSRVFRAKERATGGFVAIKRLDKAQQRLLNDDPIQWEREVELLRRCASHPNVVALHDVMETSEYVYIIMELAEGGELFQALIDEGAYSEWDARRFITDLLQALNFLHKLGIAHRDVKPENLLITSINPKLATIKLADFGLATLVEESSLLSHGRMTWAYCAPEVFKTSSLETPASTEEAETLPAKSARNSQVGFQCDMWSVGIVLYVLLSGVHPFDPDGRQTRDQMINNIQLGQISMTGSRWDAISNEAKDLISTLIHTSPEVRPTSAEALRHEWFKSQRTSRKSLAVSISDTEGLRQYRHLMRRKFRTSVVATVAADTLRRSLKKGCQSAGSNTGNKIDAVDVPPGPMQGPEFAGAISSYSCSPDSTVATIVAVSGEPNGECRPVTTHSVLKNIFHHNYQEENRSLEVVTVNASDADVEEM